MQPHQYKLPYFQRHIFHKTVGINVFGKVRLITAIMMLTLLVAAGLEYVKEHDLRVAAAAEHKREYDLRLIRENEVRDLLAVVTQLPRGAPGTTLTDYREGTQVVKVHMLGWKTSSGSQ